MNTAIPIVFTLAKGRSGTTLLQTILDAHPNTIAPFESRFVIHFKNRYGSITNWNDQIKSTFIKDVLAEQKIAMFWDLDKDKLTQLINDLPQKTTYGEVCKQVYLSVNSIFEKQSPKVIIDKNPVYNLLIGPLLEVYPYAKFIHVIRDYRACTNSTHKLLPSKSITRIGHEWIQSNLEIEHFKALYPNRFITIRYEDLLTDLEHQLELLCDFMEISYQHEMINYHKKTTTAIENFIKNAPNEKIKRIRSFGVSAVHKNLSRPVDPSLMNNWKTQLTDEQIKSLDRICNFYGQHYQYTADYKSDKKTPFPLSVKLKKFKIQLYYRLPIRLRELKSKPSLAFIPKNI